MPMLPKSIPAAWSPMPPPRPAIHPPGTRPTLVVALDEADVPRYALPAFNRVVAKSPAELLAALTRERPSAVLLDLDVSWVDAAATCRTAVTQARTNLLAITRSPDAVVPVLRAGCHGVLLKPFAPNLLAARLGRLMREAPSERRRHESGDVPWLSQPRPRGTNRAWPEVSCPRCSAPNAWSFEFASHRRMWFACLGCDHVWVGARLE
jgi:CheY-like chemotaxis protein